MFEQVQLCELGTAPAPSTAGTRPRSGPSVRPLAPMEFPYLLCAVFSGVRGASSTTRSYYQFKVVNPRPRKQLLVPLSVIFV